MARRAPTTNEAVPSAISAPTPQRGVAAGDVAIFRAAIAARDAAFDGRFVYSVATTGIYCRPSCASRQARPEHIALHASCADAEAAGFRSCKRCKPGEAPAREHAAARMAAICRHIESAETSPKLAELAAMAGVSPFQLQRLFKAVVGVTPKAYAQAHRRARVRAGLAAGGGSVTEAIYDAGYNAPSRFYAAAPAALGMSPTAFRDGGAATELRFAVGQCSLGAILVAASAKGVAAILLGDDAEALLRDLQDRFARARLIGGDADFEAVVAKVVGLVEQPDRGLALPLDVRGTAFQQRVWQALRDIPAGHTASYADIARRIGRPEAVRAVASACAANAHAVAIPCHRVVRSDGALSGYRWGIARKRALLERERRR